MLDTSIMYICLVSSCTESMQTSRPFRFHLGWRSQRLCFPRFGLYRNSQHSDSKSFRVGKQGKTATNKDNNINIIKALHYCHISPNMACFCKLMAQNWHKNLPHTDHKNGVTELYW